MTLSPGSGDAALGVASGATSATARVSVSAGAVAVSAVGAAGAAFGACSVSLVVVATTQFQTSFGLKSCW